MSIFSRLFGICQTKPPADNGCWRYAGGRVELDLGRAKELSQPGGAVRLEGYGLPRKVLLVHGTDGEIHALENKCAHAGRRLDPLPGKAQVECCSVGKSTYDYDGKLISGSASQGVTVFPVAREGQKLIVDLAEERRH